FGLHSFLFDLFLRARVTGKNLSFLSAPFGNSSVSSRTESMITRALLRNGYNVMPNSDAFSKESETSASSNTSNKSAILWEDVSTKKLANGDDPDNEEIDGEDEGIELPDVLFSGGLNKEVAAQFVCPPYSIKDIDFVSFYAVIIIIFQIDLCNK